VTEKLHEEIKKKAEESNLTMKEYIELLMTNPKGTKIGK
jgi:hypothetical protein